MMMLCHQSASPTNSLSCRIFCLVSLLMSSCARGGAGAGTAHQIVVAPATGTAAASASSAFAATVLSSSPPLLDPHAMGRRGGEERNNHSMSSCPRQNAAAPAVVATAAAAATDGDYSTPTATAGGGDGLLFSTEQHQSFARDGFLLVSDLLDVTMLQELTGAGNAYMAGAQKMDAYFSSIEMGMIFQAGGSSNSNSDGSSSATTGGGSSSSSSSNNTTNQTITRAFRNVAFDSVLPRAAAELMQLSPSEHVRVLR
jgi:hypothetical protein